MSVKIFFAVFAAVQDYKNPDFLRGEVEERHFPIDIYDTTCNYSMQSK